MDGRAMPMHAYVATLLFTMADLDHSFYKD